MSEHMQNLLLIGTAHAELFGTSTSVRSIALKYGVKSPTGRRWFVAWDGRYVGNRAHWMRTYRMRMHGLNDHQQELLSQHLRFMRDWVYPHEELRKKGLIEKPEKGPSHLTEAGWQKVDDLLRKDEAA